MLLLTNIKSLWNYRSRIAGIFSILILVILITILPNILINTSYATDRLMTKQEFGHWTHVSFNGELKSKSSYDSTGNLYIISETNDLIIGSFDDGFSNLAYIDLIKGRLPINSSEIVVDYTNIAKLGLTFDLNQIISLNTITQDNEFVVVGFYNNFSSKWIQDTKGDFVYPAILTTDIQTDKYAQFGYFSKPSILFTTTDQLNTLSYPELTDIEGNGYKLFLEELSLRNNQVESITRIVLALAIFILFTFIRMHIAFFERKTKILRTLGITSAEEIIYHLSHGAFFSFFAFIGFIVIERTIELLVSLNSSIDYLIDYDVFRSVIITIIITIVFFFLIFSISASLKPLVPNLIIKTKQSIIFSKATHYLLIVIVTVFSFTQLTIGLFRIYDNHLPNIEDVKERNTEGYMYRIYTNTYDVDHRISMDDLSEFETDHNNVTINYHNSYLLNSMNSLNQERLIQALVMSEVHLNRSESIVHEISESFLAGESILVNSNNLDFLEFLDSDFNDSIYLNGIQFKVEVLDFNQYTSLFSNPIIDSVPVLISESVVEKLGYEAYSVNNISISVPNSADTNDIEKDVYRLASGSMLLNGKVEFELLLKELDYEMQRDIFLVVLYLIIGFTLIISVFSNLLSNQRKSIGTELLLGFENKQLWKKHLLIPSISLVLFALLSVFLGYYVFINNEFNSYIAKWNNSGNLESPMDKTEFIDQLIRNSQLTNSYYSVALIVLLVVILILVFKLLILRRISKLNPFELVSERK